MANVLPSVVQIMPCLDIRGGRVVKGVQFVDMVDAGDPVACAAAYEESGADELGLLDIAATVEKRRTLFEVVRRVKEAVKIPVMVGGGIKSLGDIELALAAGAGRVSISTAAWRDAGFVGEAVRVFGGGRVLVAIDADRNEALPSKREVYIDGGRTATGGDVVEFAKKVTDLGVEAILLTSKGGDGTRNGYDIELIRGVADATGKGVVASGGAGTLAHFYDAVVLGHADTLLAASVFHFGLFTVRQVKAFLAGRGIHVHGEEKFRKFAF